MKSILAAAFALLMATGAFAVQRHRPSRPPADSIIYPRSGLTGHRFSGNPPSTMTGHVVVSDGQALAADNGTNADGTIPVRIWRSRGEALGVVGRLCNVQTINVKEEAGTTPFTIDPAQFRDGDVLYFEHRASYRIDYLLGDINGGSWTDSTSHLLTGPWIGIPIGCD
jgi:hypothetical protein